MPSLHTYPGSPHQPQVSPLAPDRTLLEYALPQALIQRLQREQGWSPDFTGQAVREYRRFLCLAASAGRSGHAVTPSQTVDAVWHTHLTFTRDYWERLVPLLPAPLHHEPGREDGSDDQRHHEQYLRTLDAYAELFGERPPAPVWPDPRWNMAPAAPTLRRWPPALLAAGAGLLAWMTFAWSSAALWIGAGVFLVTLVLAWPRPALPAGPSGRESRTTNCGGSACGGATKGGGDSGGSGCSGSGCSGSGCGGGCSG